tara:strand:- start:579 stop:1334 length:756 start_codon:yes stop_codon:yes gene_type:complete
MTDYSVLVLSCDKYEPLWSQFFERFFKYWPKKNENVSLLTNFANPNFENVNNILIGEDRDWSSNLLLALSSIKTEYVFIILDDVFIKSYIDVDFFDHLLDFVNKEKPNYLNTKNRPVPRGPKKERYVRELVKGSHYRSSITNAFWKTKTLKSLLVPGENPWEFERKGAFRSNNLNSFFGTTKSLIQIHHLIIGGKISRSVWRSIEINKKVLSSFPIQTIFEEIKHELTILRNKSFSKLVPQKWQQIIRKQF